MNSGNLDRIISIQASTWTVDAYGGRQTTWADLYGAVWADVQPLQGQEYFQTAQIQNSVDTRFVIRYIPGIKAKMRVLFKNETYNIVSVIDKGDRRTEMELMTVRVTT